MATPAASPEKPALTPSGVILIVADTDNIKVQMKVRRLV